MALQFAGYIQRSVLLCSLYLGLFLFASCGTPSTGVSQPGTPVVAVPTATPTALGATATPGDIKTQVAQAYLNYWKVYSQALYNLDTSQVAYVAADAELQRIALEVQDFRKENHALQAVIAHNYAVTSIQGNDKVVLVDHEADSSYLIDPVTKQVPRGYDPKAKIPTNKYTVIYYFRLIDGKWKVILASRQK